VALAAKFGAAQSGCVITPDEKSRWTNAAADQAAEIAAPAALTECLPAVLCYSKIADAARPWITEFKA